MIAFVAVVETCVYPKVLRADLLPLLIQSNLDFLGRIMVIGYCHTVIKFGLQGSPTNQAQNVQSFRTLVCVI